MTGRHWLGDRGGRMGVADLLWDDWDAIARWRWGSVRERFAVALSGTVSKPTTWKCSFFPGPVRCWVGHITSFAL